MALDTPLTSMNPADPEPQLQDELQALKESHAQESCKLTALQAAVHDMQSSLQELMNLAKKRSPSHQAESPITSEEDHEEIHGVLYLGETSASRKDVRDGYSTSSSSSSTSSSSTSYDIPSRDRTASIALQNGISTARDTFFNGTSTQLTNAVTNPPMNPQTGPRSNYLSSSPSDIPSRLYYESHVNETARIATLTIITVQGPYQLL